MYLSFEQFLDTLKSCYPQGTTVQAVHGQLIIQEGSRIYYSPTMHHMTPVAMSLYTGLVAGIMAQRGISGVFA